MRYLISIRSIRHIRYNRFIGSIWSIRCILFIIYIRSIRSIRYYKSIQIIRSIKDIRYNRFIIYWIHMIYQIYLNHMIYKIYQNLSGIKCINNSNQKITGWLEIKVVWIGCLVVVVCELGWFEAIWWPGCTWLWWCPKTTFVLVAIETGVAAAALLLEQGNLLKGIDNTPVRTKVVLEGCVSWPIGQLTQP